MFLLKLILKNAFRHKLRSLLTIAGLAVALLAFSLLRTVLDAWNAGVEASSATRLVTRNKISLVFPLPLSYREKLRAAPGVRIVSYGNWFGGIYVDEKNFFPNFAVEPGSYLELYPELLLDEAERAHFLRERKSCIVGRKTAKRFGWKIGDTVTLKGTIFPGNWDFVVRGIYRGAKSNTDETQLLFHWAYLDERMKRDMPRRAGQIGFYMLGISDANRSAGIAAEIDESFKNSLAETLTETEKAFQLGFVSMSEAILAAIRIVSLLVILIILAVAANTMSMSVRERFGEYAVLKTLGFRGGAITLMILGESLTLSLFGFGLGMLLLHPLAKGFGQALSDFFPFFQVSLATVLYSLLAAFLVGLISALAPAWTAARAPIVEAFRRFG